MRFFFECVTCFSVANPPPPPPPSSTTNNTPESVASSPTEESSLVAITTQRRRKRTPTRGSSAEWKPSLYMISEDKAVSATPKKVVDRTPVNPVGSSRNVKHCGPSSVQANARSQSHNFSREPLPMAFPAFSGAPFMF